MLVKEQESAVKAVRLERLVGNIGEMRKRKRSERRREEVNSKLSVRSSSPAEDPVQEEEEIMEEFTESEKRRILSLTAPSRPWLWPGYNK